MDINYNAKCYRFENIKYTEGILDKTVDCTYVIHLENNGRFSHIRSELDKIKPTKNCFIVFNKGFKNCNKKLIDQASYQDLSDAFLQCFRHANENNYGNILILEDDFIFNEEIKNTYNVNNIETFLNSRKNESFVYFLGLIPIISYPVDVNMIHYRALNSLTMHSAIYSKECVRNVEKLRLHYKHWDVIISKSISDRYFYCKPLCYQTFPDTDNRKSWGEKDSVNLINDVKTLVISSLNMDERPEPGFSIIYFISKLFFVLSIFIIVLFVFYAAKLTRQYVKKNGINNYLYKIF